MMHSVNNENFNTGEKQVHLAGGSSLGEVYENVRAEDNVNLYDQFSLSDEEDDDSGFGCPCCLPR